MVATTINRPKQPLYKNLRKLRRVQKQRRKKNLPFKQSAVQDAEIMPRGMMKKRMTCSKANITLSGKKKRKILNQLRRNQSEKSKMDAASTSTSKAGNKKAKKNVKTDQDVVMKDES